MNAILSLRPNVTREEAVRTFLPRTPMGLMRGLAMGRLRAVAEVYLPFRLHRVEIVNRGVRHSRFFGLDAIRGELDLYGFEHAPSEADLLPIETRNRPQPVLEEARACEILVEKVRRLLFGEGFFRIRDLTISAEPRSLEFHVPYWIGIYGEDGLVRLAAIDAVRRRAEGAKVRDLLSQWLLD